MNRRCNTSHGTLLAALPIGLVLVAFPAEYRLSGVVTFIVTADGSVYESDLGPETPRLAPGISKRPRSGWEPTE